MVGGVGQRGQRVWGSAHAGAHSKRRRRRSGGMMSMRRSSGKERQTVAGVLWGRKPWREKL